MIRKAALLVAAAALAMGAAPARHPPRPAARPAKAAGPFDARDPAGLAAVLTALEAKVEPAQKDGDDVVLKVTSPVGGFSVRFSGCNAQGRACQAMLFEAGTAQRTATLQEINGFNQSSLACRAYQDKAGRPHLLYSALLFPGQSRPEMLTEVNAWRGCLADFGMFLKDPAAYLASAP